MKFKYLIFLLFNTFIFLNAEGALKEWRQEAFLMGSGFEFVIVDDEQKEEFAKAQIQIGIAEVKRLENLLSDWIDSTPTAQINKNSGIAPIKVPSELFNLIRRCKFINKMTDGAFDITVSAYRKYWKFDGTMKNLPSKNDIKDLISLMGSDKIVLKEEDSSVFLTKKGMKIGFGAIGKGYAADKVIAIWKSNGVLNGVANASGDLYALGYKKDSTEWKVGIVNPLNKNKYSAWLLATNQAIVTSGNYEKFIEFEGKKYSHILDPRTCMPAQGILSVTVVGNNTELADALATSIFVLGIENGIKVIEQIPKFSCLIIDEFGAIFTSRNINILDN